MIMAQHRTPSPPAVSTRTCTNTPKRNRALLRRGDNTRQGASLDRHNDVRDRYRVSPP